MWRKLLLTVSVFILLVFSCSSDKSGQNNLQDERLRILENSRKQLVETVEQLGVYRASEIYKSLKKCLDVLTELEKRVNARDSMEKILSDARKAFKDMYTYLQEIDDARGDIKTKYNQLLRVFYNIDSDLQKQINLVDMEINQIRNEIADIEQRKEKGQLSRGDDIKYNSLQTQLSLKQSFRTVIVRFLDYVKRVNSTSDQLKDRVERFLDIVLHSIPIYKEAYVTVTSVEIFYQFVGTMTEVFDPFEKLSSDLQDSWLTVQRIIEEISQMKFTYHESEGEPTVVKAGFFSNLKQLFDRIVRYFKGLFRKTWADVARLLVKIQQKSGNISELLSKKMKIKG